MASGIFYRNVRARDQLELFLLSAASGLLLVRFYLYLTGFPQLGGRGLHIAHMLWGGLLMLVALAMALSFLGGRVLRAAAVVGGAGFGVFIDELGKFITRDNDYFYRPAIGLIYVIFIALYLAFNFLSRTRPLSSREYQLNALAQLEEAIVRDMNPTEKARVQELIHQADPRDPLTRQLQQFLDRVQTIPAAAPRRISRALNRLHGLYAHFWARKSSNQWVAIFFVLEVVVFTLGVVGGTFSDIQDIVSLPAHSWSYMAGSAIGQLAAAIIAAAFAVNGVVKLPRSRIGAYEQFRRATLVNIFLTQVFMFARDQFAALPGFFFNLALLGLISYAIRQEQRLRRPTS